MKKLMLMIFLTLTISINAQSIMITMFSGGPIRTLGPELVTDITIGCGATWSCGTGWAIVGETGVGTATTGNLINIAPFVGLSSGDSVQVTYTITGFVDGLIRFELSGAVNGDLQAANGTFTQTLQFLDSNDQLHFDGIAAFTGVISGLSAKQVTYE